MEAFVNDIRDPSPHVGSGRGWAEEQVRAEMEEFLAKIQQRYGLREPVSGLWWMWADWPGDGGWSAWRRGAECCHGAA